MGDEILELGSPIGYDDTITNIQYHSYNPFTNSFNYSDEIRIVIQNQDLYVLLHKSYIYIEGTVVVNAPAAAAAGANQAAINAANAAREPPNFVNNAAAFLFDEIRYELNGFQIDSCKNVGITSTLKGYISFTPHDVARMANASWNKESNTPAVAGTINFCIPLKNIFGFAEDYQNILMNAKHELILLRSRNDTNALVGANNISTITINKIQWHVPHVTVSDEQKLKLFQIIEKQLDVTLQYRSWELYEYPVLPTTDKHIWSVKASSQLNTPRFVVIGFQTNRNNQITADKSRFDHCQLNDLKVFLNSECYPYESVNANFTNHQIAVLYEMYARFQESYYHDRPASCSGPMLTLTEFRENAPIIVIDCSHQNEILKKGIVDIRIEFQTRANIPANTAAYCLVLHDNIVSYNPYSNIVSRGMSVLSSDSEAGAGSESEPESDSDNMS